VLADEVPDAWDRAPLRAVGQFPPPPAEAMGRFDEHPRLGWRLWSASAGTFLVSARGDRITCVPNAQAPVATWHRFLLSQVIPLAAVLQGLELLHASAVTLAGGVFAFAARSGVGKTSLALRLFLRGAGWMADDVVALDVSGPDICSHPGPGITCIRRGEAGSLRPDEWARLGPRVASSAEEVLQLIPRAAGPLPLRSVYFLERIGDTELRREPLDDPEVLLGSFFWPALPTPERLASALLTAGRLSAAVPLFRLGVPKRLDAAGLAEALEEQIWA
jgi:hypothetical protein